MRRIFLRALFSLTIFFTLFFFFNWIEAGEEVKIENPLKYNTFEELFSGIVNILFKLAIVIAPLMIVIAGYYFVVSAGNPAKIETAKNIILYTMIGLLVILLSKGFISLIKEIFIEK